MPPLAATLLLLVAQLTPGTTPAVPGRPDLASHSPPDLHLRLDELLVVNRGGVQDDAGEAAPWLELRNTSPGEVDAGGLVLLLGGAPPWSLPHGVLVPAHGRRLLWLDGQPDQGPDHAPFVPSPDGGVLRLLGSDGSTELDRVAFGPQVADVSVGRLDADPEPDQWFTQLDPTPGAPPLDAPSGVHHYKAHDPEKNRIVYKALGPAILGQTTSFRIEEGVVGEPIFFYVATQPRHLGLPGGSSVLLVDLQFPTVALDLDSEGALTFDVLIPGNPAYAGLTIFTQVLHPISHYPGSNAVALTLTLPPWWD